MCVCVSVWVLFLFFCFFLNEGLGLNLVGEALGESHAFETRGCTFQARARVDPNPSTHPLYCITSTVVGSVQLFAVHLVSFRS